MRAAADHAAELGALGGAALCFQQLLPPADLVAHGCEQPDEAIEVERLGKEVDGAKLDRLDDAVHCRVAAHQDHLAVDVGGADGTQHVEAAGPWHTQVHRGDVEVTLLKLSQRLAAAGAGRGREPCTFGNRSDEFADAAIVINYKERRMLQRGRRHRH
jgi:hypothetical protein